MAVNAFTDRFFSSLYIFASPFSCISYGFFLFTLVSSVFHRDIAAVAAVVVASYVANK